MPKWEAALITTLSGLKLILSAFAASAGVSLLILLQFLISRIAHAPGKTAYWPGSKGTFGYERMIRKECAKHVWFLVAGETVGGILMLAAAFFHRKIAACAGEGIFLILFPFLFVWIFCCVLLRNRWKSGAFADLVSYTELFVSVYGNTHSGIRMMLACTAADIPFRAVMLAIWNRNPGLSGDEVLEIIGNVLETRRRTSAFTGRNERTEKNEKARSLSRFSAVLSGISFVIVLWLLFLLN